MSIIAAQRRFWCRLRSVIPVRPAQWDRSRNLRGGLALALLLCSAGSIGNWYNLLRHSSDLSIPILVACTAGVVLVVLVAPRKVDLIAICLAGYFILALIHTALGGTPLLFGLEAMGVTGVSCFVAALVGNKMRQPAEQEESATARAKKC